MKTQRLRGLGGIRAAKSGEEERDGAVWVASFSFSVSLKYRVDQVGGSSWERDSVFTSTKGWLAIKIFAVVLGMLIDALKVLGLTSLVLVSAPGSTNQDLRNIFAWSHTRKLSSISLKSAGMDSIFKLGVSFLAFSGLSSDRSSSSSCVASKFDQVQTAVWRPVLASAPSSHHQTNRGPSI